MNFKQDRHVAELRAAIEAFVRDQVLPLDDEYGSWLAKNEHGDHTRWTEFGPLQALKSRARDAGLWNLFLPDESIGQGLSTVQYAPLAEAMGWHPLAPEIFNCNAPDSGNMEVLYHFGNPAQQEQWLTPLAAGDIRSVFCMTEPDVASSDATNMGATITADGDELILNGKKWWTTGLGHPRAAFAIFMGLSGADEDRHRRHSMVIVPLDAPGVTIRRMLKVFGDYDAPHGHGEVWFDEVRVPRANLIGKLGDGFAIAQGRLGPGRIHHCMRAIGAAEHALSLMVRRGMKRVAFGKPLIRLGGNLEKIADLRTAIDQARLLTLHAAWRLDEVGPMAALKEISQIKVVAPNVLQRVADEAIQMYGGEGVSADAPLAGLFAMARSLRIADGPDAVHRSLIGRMELKKYG